MWDGLVGTISATENQIKLTDDTKPSSQQPDRTEVVKRKLEEEEFEKNLNLDVIEQTTSKWAAQIVFALNKCDELRL